MTRLAGERRMARTRSRLSSGENPASPRILRQRSWSRSPTASPASIMAWAARHSPPVVVDQPVQVRLQVAELVEQVLGQGEPTGHEQRVGDLGHGRVAQRPPLAVEQVAARIGLPRGHEQTLAAHAAEPGRVVAETPAAEKLRADVAPGLLVRPRAQGGIVVDGPQGGGPGAVAGDRSSARCRRTRRAGRRRTRSCAAGASRGPPRPGASCRPRPGPHSRSGPPARACPGRAPSRAASPGGGAVLLLGHGRRCPPRSCRCRARSRSCGQRTAPRVRAPPGAVDTNRSKSRSAARFSSRKRGVLPALPRSLSPSSER